MGKLLRKKLESNKWYIQITKEETKLKNWFNKNKPIFITLGIVFILLALFLVPAFSRVSYEGSLSGDSAFSGDTMIEVFGKVVSDSR